MNMLFKRKDYLNSVSLLLLSLMSPVSAQEQGNLHQPQKPDTIVDSLQTTDDSIDDPADFLRNNIEALKIEQGLFSTELIKPLTELGLLLQNKGEHVHAMNELKRAQYVLHRNFGVLDISQTAIIQAIVNSQIALVEHRKVKTLLQLIRKINQNHYGKQDLKMLPILLGLANGYLRINELKFAQQHFKEARDIVKNTPDANPMLMIPALEGLAQSYQYEPRTPLAKGIKTYQEIVSIADNSADFDAVQRIYAHQHLGDWYLVSGKHHKAWQEYRLAWQLSQLPSAGLRDWSAYFAEPVIINPGQNLPPGLLVEAKVPQGAYYDFEIKILANGRTRGLRFIATNLPSWTRRIAILAFRNARFRPALINGEAVDSPAKIIRRHYPDAPPGTQKGSYRTQIR